MITTKHNLHGIGTQIEKLHADLTTKATLNQGNKILLEEIKKRAPKKSGKYKKSWRIATSSRNYLRVVTSQRKLYQWLEFTGTKSHIIRARRAKMLHWKDEQGNDRFAKQVNHPGTQPKPHARPAVRAAAPKIRKMIIQNLKSRNKWLR